MNSRELIIEKAEAEEDDLDAQMNALLHSYMKKCNQGRIEREKELEPRIQSLDKQVSLSLNAIKHIKDCTVTCEENIKENDTNLYRVDELIRASDTQLQDLRIFKLNVQQDIGALETRMNRHREEIGRHK